jgi:uncharacterized protein YjbI with pentapeptide repeats
MNEPLTVINEFDDIAILESNQSGVYDCSDAIFKCPMDFTGRSIKLYSFRNSIFEDVVHFDNIQFSDNNIQFQNTTFKNDVFFKNVRVAGNINFNNSEFLGIAYFDNFKVDLTSSFEGVNFKGLVVFDNSIFGQISNFSKSYFEKEVRFCNAKFLKEVNFSQSIFNNNLNFSKAQFNQEVLFEKTRFLGETDFSNVELKWHVKYALAEFSGITSFKNAKFLYASNFYGAVFNKETNFVNANFQRATFNKSKFQGSTYFDYAQFSDDALFDEIELTGDLQFKRVQFLNFTNFRIISNGTGILNFESSSFDKLLDLRQSHISNVILTNALFKGIVNFTDGQFNKMNLTGAVFKEVGLFKNCSIDQADRETFRIAKHELLKINNKIDALLYHKKEMMAYWEELCQSKWYQNRAEKFILIMNRISNGFGLNWWRGIVFTGLTALIFFIPYLLCLKNPYFQWGWESWSAFWEVTGQTVKYYVEFFYAAHKLDFMEQYEPRGIAYVLDMVGRVFITYGYYQTIQAFRKYGRW